MPDGTYNAYMILQTWGDALNRSFIDLGVGVVHFIPNLLAALVIFLAGWILGAFLGRVVTRVIDALKLDEALRGVGLEVLVHRAGFQLNLGKFIGVLVEWFTIVVFLIAAFDVLKLQQVNYFLQEVVIGYLPKVIVAVLILLVGGVLAQVTQRVVTGSARAAGLAAANFLGTLSKWSVWVFAFLVALSHLDIGTFFLQTFFMGVTVAVSVAVGLAFGLGGQETAARMLERVRKEVEDR